ncbi:MAG: TIR domain-containing protein [Bacilli bacterium]|nr:TIR domain-containing protein [Bacilli bacterium]
MGHKVFVSYKFNDAAGTRDRIITALKGNGSYYKGEVGYKALEIADSTMKQYLGSMIFDSTVTVIIISPNVTQSKWVDWEIKYSLENHTRRDCSSGRNGIVCVIQKQIDYSSPKPSYFGVYNENSNRAYNKYLRGNNNVNSKKSIC